MGSNGEGVARAVAKAEVERVVVKVEVRAAAREVEVKVVVAMVREDAQWGETRGGVMEMARRVLVTRGIGSKEEHLVAAMC